MTRAFRCVLLGAAAVVLAAVPRRAAAQGDSIVAQVGGDLAGTAGFVIDVPITVDLRGAPGRALGGYRARLAWDPAALGFNDLTGDGFASPTYASDSAYGDGVLRFTALLPAGATGVVQIATVQFYVYTDTAPTPIALTFDDLTASAGSVTPFEDLLPLLRIVNGTFCKSLGRWGDVDGDSRANSRDALAALSAVVGLPTPGMNTALADVDADGAVTSRDALIILSYAVGLPVPGYRVLLPAAGACGTGAAQTLVIRPDTIDLVPGQVADVVPELRDAAGRAVPATNLTWSSDNGVVAGLYVEPGDAPPPPLAVSPSAASTGPVAIEGRQAGVARLTATAGPGVRGVLVVRVAPRRSTWYADVLRARNAVTQLGTMRYPMEYIGNAVWNAGPGDTIRVAGGTYEETIYEDRGAIILGDSLDRPVIDGRGAPYFDPMYSRTIELYGGAPTVMAHLVFRGGGIYLEGRTHWLRNLRVENAAGYYPAVEIYGYSGGGEAPPATPQPASAMAAGAGRVLIEDVVITHGSRGILVEDADTVDVRNASVAGDHAYQTCSASWWSDNGIAVEGRSRITVSGNDVSGSRCAGIAAFSDTGRVHVAGNRVNDVGQYGIIGSARGVGLDHNVVRSVHGDPAYYYSSAGIFITAESIVDSVTFLADSVGGVEGYDANGVSVEWATATVADSLRIDDIGIDSMTTYGAAAFFAGHRVTVRSGRVSNAYDGVLACGDRLVLRTRGNHVRASGGSGIGGYACQQGPGPDSLMSVSDTVANAQWVGIGFSDARYVSIDSARVDTTAQAGLWVADDAVVRIRDSRVRAGMYGGIYVAQGTGTVALLRDSVLDSPGDGVQLNLENGPGTDTMRVDGVTVTNAVGAGVWVRGAGTLTIDSSRFIGNRSGVEFSDAGLGVVGARITRSRLAGNAIYGAAIGTPGIAVDLGVTSSTIEGNGAAGVFNDNPGSATLTATGNYWGDPAGPRCSAAVTGCSGTSVSGDSITSLGVTFVPFLTTPNPLVPTAPAVGDLAPTALRVARGASAVVRPRRPRASPGASVPAATTRPERLAPGPRRPSWQKGRPLVDRASDALPQGR